MAIPITVHITNENFNSPSNTLPFDYYTGGKYNAPVSIDNDSYQSALVQYSIEGNMQESFSFVPTTSALDLGEGDVTLTDNDYLTISEKPAWDLLEKWSSINSEFAYYSFRKSCNLNAHPNCNKFYKWVRNKNRWWLVSC